MFAHLWQPPRHRWGRDFGRPNTPKASHMDQSCIGVNKFEKPILVRRDPIFSFEKQFYALFFKPLSRPSFIYTRDGSRILRAPVLGPGVCIAPSTAALREGRTGSRLWRRRSRACKYLDGRIYPRHPLWTLNTNHVQYQHHTRSHECSRPRVQIVSLAGCRLYDLGSTFSIPREK